MSAISANLIETELIRHTVNASNFEPTRKYIGLSRIQESADRLAYYYENEQIATEEQKLKCYKGYQEEKDLVQRLIKIFSDRISFNEISAYGGKVKGHPDCWIDDCPTDIKSYALDAYLPVDRISRKNFMQMQGYLYYSGAEKGFFICESRESGKLKVLGANPIPEVQKDIDEKIKKVITLIDALEYKKVI